MTTNPQPASGMNEAEVKPLSALMTLGIAVLFVALRLWRLSASCLWFDEIFSAHATHHGWGELLRFVAADMIHPPLFYLLLKIWIALGASPCCGYDCFRPYSALLRLFPSYCFVANLT